MRLRESLEYRSRSSRSGYVQWQMRQAWLELLWSDEEVEARWSRDPVAPAARSEPGQRKVGRKHLEDGSEVHSVY